MDERFFLHRYKSSSHASMVGAAGLGGLYFYDLLAHDVIRYDLGAILLAMVITKLGFMAWYRNRD